MSDQPMSLRELSDVMGLPPPTAEMAAEVIRAAFERACDRYGLPTDDLESAFTDVEDDDRFEWMALRSVRQEELR